MAIKNCTGWASLRALFLTIAMSLSVASVFAQSPTFARTDYPFIGQQVVGDLTATESLIWRGKPIWYRPSQSD